ncbi:MAG: MFS transporter [Puniceicoccales bacterium]|jgi:phosphoglycerate transporter family protein|nr:MFS transporter [Puniceicoccales bacterium]
MNREIKNSNESASDIVDRKYKYWRFRIVYSLIIGYAAFYLVRQTFQVAAPKILTEFGYTREQIGLGFSAFAIIYGFGKFFNGVLCDRTNARWFMTIGLIGSAVCSMCMGFANALWAFVTLYALSAAFQSAGWPPVSRLMTQWYSPHELGTKWGLVNASHQIGSIAILMGGTLIAEKFGWRHVFFVPGIVTIIIAFLVLERLRDSPRSLGLPSIEEKENLFDESGHSDKENITLREVFFEHILPNKSLWYVCFANFFVYIVRMGFFNWAPVFLRESKGANGMDVACLNSEFEFMGAIGGFVAGWLSDKAFGGRRNCTSFYFMIVLVVALITFWATPSSSMYVNTCLMFAIGFFIYGPQTLAGVSGAEFGSRRAAATGAGLTGTFGYLGSAISGWGVGKIADKWGWNAAFLFFILCAAAGAFFFMLNWNKTSQRHRIRA